MLLIGENRTRTCQGISRRGLLQAGMLGAAGLTLPDFLALRAAAAAGGDPPLALGRAGPPRYLRPEAGGAERVPRPLPGDPDARRRDPGHGALPRTGAAGGPLEPGPQPPPRDERPRPGRHR